MAASHGPLPRPCGTTPPPPPPQKKPSIHRGTVWLFCFGFFRLFIIAVLHRPTKHRDEVWWDLCERAAPWRRGEKSFTQLDDLLWCDYNKSGGLLMRTVCSELYICICSKQTEIYSSLCMRIGLYSKGCTGNWELRNLRWPRTKWKWI